VPNVATKLEDLIAARYLHRGDIPHKRKKENNWSRDTLAGRLVEIRSATAPARLTAAFGVVRNAQQHGESAVWITTTHSSFFPPDAAEGGVHLDSMPVVRLPLVNDIPRAADALIRSGAFGLVVMDLIEDTGPARRSLGEGGRGTRIRNGAPARLTGLAQKHDTAVVLLTGDPRDSNRLGPVVSLRAEARRGSKPSSSFRGDRTGVIEIRVIKDKLQATGWHHTEPCRGPSGLR
jgi:recombination protein RecA